LTGCFFASGAGSNLGLAANAHCDPIRPSPASNEIFVRFIDFKGIRCKMAKSYTFPASGGCEQIFSAGDFFR
jgi:hypothetical protein